MMKYIDLTCPAEVFRSALPTKEIPAATLTLYNLSDRVISSVEVQLYLLDGDGRETERLSFRGRALNGRPHSTFLLTVPCAAAPGLKAIEASVQKVWYADNEVWRRDPANTVEYEPNDLPVSPALTKLQYAAGDTAVGYPSLQESLWVCVCGRPNPEGQPYCVRCGRQMEEVFSRFSPEAVETQISLKQRQLDLSSRNMREDTIRLQRIREEEYKQKKARRGNRLRIAAALLLTAALIAGALFYGGPGLRLLAGRHAMEAGDYSAAKAVFETLGSFGNARELAAECDWQMAWNTAENSTSAEELANASALLRAVPSRPEALERANEADLLRSRLLLGNGDWAAALEALELLPEDYEGRLELEQDCRTAQAYALQNQGKYAEAREIWLSLANRPGAKEQAALCVYEPAKALMEKKDWDGAIQMFSTISDYSDSREKTLECHYHKAEELLEAGDAESASNEFLLAGEWSDAAERSMSLTYSLAEEKYNAGDLKGAQPIYASIPDYLDAARKDWACRYQLAKEALDDLEYTRAIELLKDVPDEYDGAGLLRAEASYQKARIALRQEDWQTAAELLGSIDRESLRRKHQDAENLYREACERAGIEPYPETPETEEGGASSVHEGGTAEPDLTPAPDPFLVTEDEGNE